MLSFELLVLVKITIKFLSPELLMIWEFTDSHRNMKIKKEMALKAQKEEIKKKQCHIWWKVKYLKM